MRPKKSKSKSSGKAQVKLTHILLLLHLIFESLDLVFIKDTNLS